MDEVERLADWLAQGGARSDGLVVREAAGGRGVFAARAIAAGTVVARIPRGLLVTREIVRASSVARQIREAGVELSSVHALFAAWIVVERRTPGSPYRPYLDVLPRDLRGFPLHAAADELALLAGTLTGAMVQELRAEVDADHARLAKVRLLRGVERDELAWARLCVGSRAYSIAVDGLDTLALIPFADLLNHDRERHTRWEYDQDTAAFIITALRDLAPGDQLYGSYGAKGNGRLLVQYGFCLDDNAHDEAELPLATPFRAPRDPAHAAAAPMLAWLRQRHAGEDAVRAAIAGAARIAQARLPASAEDDDALLARADLPPTTRNFVVARRGERAVLRAWLDFAAGPP